jgi:hypothetical protein
MAKVRHNLPPEGSIRILTITEKLFTIDNLFVNGRLSQQDFHAPELLFRDGKDANAAFRRQVMTDLCDYIVRIVQTICQPNINRKLHHLKAISDEKFVKACVISPVGRCFDRQVEK